MQRTPSKMFCQVIAVMQDALLFAPVPQVSSRGGAFSAWELLKMTQDMLCIQRASPQLPEARSSAQISRTSSASVHCSRNPARQFLPHKQKLLMSHVDAVQGPGISTAALLDFALCTRRQGVQSVTRCLHVYDLGQSLLEHDKSQLCSRRCHPSATRSRISP